MCDPNLIANDLNDYFVNIGPNLAKELNLTESYIDSMFLYDTSHDEVHKVIDKMASQISCAWY